MSNKLTPIESKIFGCLTRRAMTREELHSEVWPDQRVVGGKVLRTHMTNLRKKLLLSGSTLEVVYVSSTKLYHLIDSDSPGSEFPE